MIQGFATEEGTARFKEKHRESIAQGHFRSVNGLNLTSVGMGTYLGEPDNTTDQMVTDAVKLSIQTGAINVIDTAINYRSQKSERSVGKALKELIESEEFKRDEIFISTKNGYITNDADVTMEFWAYIQNTLIKTGIINADDISSGYHCMTIPYLADQLERSRKNLGVECIDLMYLHNSVEGQIQDVGIIKFIQMLKEVFQFYEEKRKEGKIRYYGMATWNCFRVHKDNMEYLNLKNVVNIAKEVGGEHNGFRFVQLPFNIAMSEVLTERNQEVDGETISFLETAKKLGIGVFTSIPLLQGQLLNKNAMPKFANIDSPALRCLQFVRSAGTIPLVGHKIMEHVQENLEIAKISPFNESDFNDLLAKLATPSDHSCNCK
ncbi:MAG: aldo/keto reductase [Thaumarchaeota archaeon]|nr:aldo/keto reductase [Nitrososphaerota archaeon]